MHNSFGTNVRGIMESTNSQYAEFDKMDDAGVNVKSHSGIPNTIHHKYAIADADIIASDPILLTGSHNWSNNAENNSDENTLIIHDHTTANIYLQEFTKRFNELSSTSVLNNLIDVEINVFPNPSLGEINIKTDLEIYKINVYLQDGRLLKSFNTTSFKLDRNAVYYLKIFTNSGNSIKTIIVQ